MFFIQERGSFGFSEAAPALVWLRQGLTEPGLFSSCRTPYSGITRLTRDDEFVSKSKHGDGETESSCLSLSTLRFQSSSPCLASVIGSDPWLLVTFVLLGTGLLMEPLPFLVSRAAHEVQPSHEWECHHLRPTHPAVSAKGNRLSGKAFCSFSPYSHLFCSEG